MLGSVEVRCIVCQLMFCCDKCRWNHEKSAHGLTFDCPICRGNRFLCKPEELNLHFIKHITEEHLPLQCRKCNQIFNKMDDLIYIRKCVSISELVDKSEDKTSEVDEKFDSILEKVENDNPETLEAMPSVNKTSKTAVITPTVRMRHLVDYESSEGEEDESKVVKIDTPHIKYAPKTPKSKRQRVATPHVKKFLTLMRQKVHEEHEDTSDNLDDSPVAKTTPSRNENETNAQKEMTTPTSHMPHLIKVAQVVTTSTPTHPATGGWNLFPEQGADSPLSEIENSESPAGNEPSKLESEMQPKLKSIMSCNRTRLGSQDSSEKQATIQDSVNNEASSIKTKRVKFAEDTVFEQETKIKRVYRKPKRMLTPGPQRPKYSCNPRFQALINRFEYQGMTMARTPVNNREKSNENTPPVGEPSTKPARAINFKEDSPIVESRDSRDTNELFKTCLESPGVNNAITALTTNIAGSLQNCLSTVLKTAEEETEIQFKFVITKKKVSVHLADEVEANEKFNNICNAEMNKENIWSTVAKAVKNVFWSEGASLATTPYRSYDSDSSSASKRKCEDMTDPELSPLNHKRHKYEGRIRGRPPLRRSKTWVSSLRSSKSAEQQSLINEVSREEVMNQSF